MIPEQILQILSKLSSERNIDLIYYVGEINRQGYAGLCDILAKPRRKNVALILSTLGGDADAGFRIARSLQHHYGEFEAWIPSYCKSAGTLICLGAARLVMADRSELGPLDVQIRKQDELFDYGSGLDVIQSLGHMQTQAMNAFRAYLIELQSGAGLSTRTAAEIATKLATGLFSPIYGQIDPVRLGELQRSTNIANAYGEILAGRSRNLKDGAVARLVANFPSHGFVIDRSLARDHFVNVAKPDDYQADLLQWVFSLGHQPGGASTVFDLNELIQAGGTHDSTTTEHQCGGNDQTEISRPSNPEDVSKRSEEQPSSRSVGTNPDRGTSRAEDEQAGTTDHH